MRIAMRNFIRSVTLAAFGMTLGTGLEASAANWTQVAQGGGATTYADISSAKRQGDLVIIWVKAVYSPAIRIVDRDPPVTDDIALKQYNCTEGKSKFFALSCLFR